MDFSRIPVAEEFAEGCRSILAGALTGVYLHGSAAMGCFDPRRSDIDLLVIVSRPMTLGEKRELMALTAVLNEKAPKKGIEMSAATASVCKPFVYPTPFELHFSITHLNRYRSDPEAYIRTMNGTDKDLAAHFTVTYHRGIVLYGKPVCEVFAPVPEEHYFDSILCDVENAAQDILSDPVYIILNLCRVLAFKRQGLVLSKKEGGEWGREIVPPRFAGLVSGALDAYTKYAPFEPDPDLSRAYAAFMLTEIRN